MCRGKDHPHARRCQVTDRERAMATARRRILRINKRLEAGVTNEQERKALVDKALVARTMLEDARNIKIEKRKADK